MPLCRLCGHSRRDHRGVYESIAIHACGVATRDEFGWLVGTCSCSGYEPLADGEPLSDAPFAEPDVLPPLRIVGRPAIPAELRLQLDITPVIVRTIEGRAGAG